MPESDDLVPQFVQLSDETVLALTRLRRIREQLKRSKIAFQRLVGERQELLKQLEAALKASPTVRSSQGDGFHPSPWAHSYHVRG